MSPLIADPVTASGMRAPLVTLISASGGVGKSTLALAISHLAAFAGIDTALVEGDLQFGDFGFWLGIDLASPNLSAGTGCEPIPVSNHLDLYKAPILPEVAEELSEPISLLVSQIRTRYQLVIADTGQFWSGLTGQLLCSSDLILLIMDNRRASLYGAIKALELCQRLGIPSARIARVLNRASTVPRSELDRMKELLGCSEIHRVADGRANVEAHVSMGRIEELVEAGAAPFPDLDRLLGALLPRIGLEFSSKPPKKQRRFFS